MVIPLQQRCCPWPRRHWHPHRTAQMRRYKLTEHRDWESPVLVLVAVNKYLARGSQGREGLFRLPVWGCGHHGRDTMAMGACSGCPHCIHGQEAERIVCWCPAHFRPCILSGTPAHRIVVLVFRVGFPPLLTHQYSLSQTSSVHDGYREFLLFWTHWAFHTRGRCTLGAFTQNHSSLLTLNTKYWHWLYKKGKINQNAWFKKKKHRIFL